MKNLLTFIILSIFSIVSHGQIKYTPQYVPQQYVPKYDIRLMEEVLKARQAAYDMNWEKVIEIQNSILDSKMNTKDKGVLSILDKYYNELEKMKEEDLSLMGNEISNLNLNMKRELVNYRTNPNSQNYSSPNETNTVNIPPKANPYTGSKKVTHDCYILKEPNDNSPKLLKLNASGGYYVEILSISGNYLYVKYLTTRGYISKYCIE